MNLYLQEPPQAQSGVNMKIHCGTHDNPTVGGQLLSQNQQDRDTSCTRGSQYNWQSFSPQRSWRPESIGTVYLEC